MVVYPEQEVITWIFLPTGIQLSILTIQPYAHIYIYIYTINNPQFWFIVGLTTFLNRFYEIYIYTYNDIDILYNTI